MNFAASASIPLTQKLFYKDSDLPLIRKKITNTIQAKYGNVINNIARISNVPKELIESFIFIESSGEANAQTPYAVGLMQVNPATASDVMVKEKLSGRLNAEESAIIKKYLGTRYEKLNTVNSKTKYTIGTFVTNEDLFKPEFNVLIGTLLLGQLIDEFTENGHIRFDKIVVIYNTGRFSKTSKTVIPYKGNTDSLMAVIPKGQSDYVLKLVGKNSVLDLLT